MFDGSLPEIGELTALEDPAVVDAVGGWARVEAAACARKQAAMAEVFCRRTGLETADERDGWWVDPCAAVGAELGAAQNVSAGLALAQTYRGVALRDRLPEVGALFEAGQISDLLVRAIVSRTALINDADAMANVDAELADRVRRWGPLSAKKTEQAIDAVVEQVDPGAVRRARSSSRARDVVIGSADEEPGLAAMWGRLYASDAAALERRLDEMARSVCEDDPRTLGERRADALGALGAGARVLGCACGHRQCPAAVRSPDAKRNMVVHVVADAAALEAAAQEQTPGPAAPPEPPAPAEVPPAPAEVPPAASASTAAGAGGSPPLAFVMGGGVLPGSLLAELIDGATVRPIRHPGDGPAEPGYVPSQTLSDFVRCRDLTCRFPGCDRPAERCDVDHTVAYPVGPTHASNLKCLCRFHHLLKTFWCGRPGWCDRQLPDGTVIWTSPTGHTYTTRPGSALLFPSLCLPTATLQLPAPGELTVSGHRGVMMPKRRRTRAQNRARSIAAERRLNDDYVAEHDKPPPI